MAEAQAVAGTAQPSEFWFMPVIDDFCYRAQLTSRNQKMTSAVGATKVLGFAIGAIFALAMVLLPLKLLGGI